MSKQNPAIGGYTAFLGAQAQQMMFTFAKGDGETMRLAWDGQTIIREEKSGVRKSLGAVIAQAGQTNCFQKMSVAIIDALNQGWVFTTDRLRGTDLHAVSVLDYIDGDPGEEGIGFFISWEKSHNELTVPEALVRTDLGSAVFLKETLWRQAGFPKPISGTVREGSDNFFALWRLKKSHPEAVKMMSLSTNSDIELKPQEWRERHTEVMEEFGLIMPGMKIDTSKAKLKPVSFF